jgi:membrane-associated protease RseP (regulator of RpoE activity)
VAGARVSAGGVAGYVPAGKTPRGTVVSDADGHFLLTGVHPGSATITADSSVAGRGSVKGIEVSSGRTVRGLRITLAPRAESGESDSTALGSIAIGLGERGSAPNIEVVIVSVAESSEAERAGLEPGDVITALDGARPGSMRDARVKLGGQPGSDVVIELTRGGNTQRFRVLREATRK